MSNIICLETFSSETEMQNPQLDSVDQVLALEEEHRYLTEALIKSSDIDTGLKDIARLTGTAVSFENLAMIARRIHEATPEELALMETIGDVAASGSAITPEEFVPALEDILGKPAPAESFTQTAQRLWVGAERSLAIIWAKIFNYYQGNQEVISSIYQRTQTIHSLASNRTDTLKPGAESNYDPKGSPRSLLYNGTVFKDGKQLVQQLDELRGAVDYVRSQYVPAISKTIENVASTIGRFNGNNEKAVLESLISLLDSSLPDAIKIPKSTKERSKSGSAELARGRPLLGDTALVSRFNFSPIGQEPDISVLSHYRQTRLGLDTQGVSKDPEVKYPILSPDEVKQVTQAIGQLLKSLAKLADKEILTNVRKSRDSLIKATKTLAKKKLGPGSNTFFRELINFNSTYAMWIKTPMSNLQSNGLTTIRSALVVCNASLKAYETSSKT